MEQTDANSKNVSTSDTFGTFHDYEIRWTPDKIEWYVDGTLGRTQERKDTWNATSQNWGFPQTPSRVQLSLWPGGLATNPKGTIDWAGGPIDWDAADIKNVGYFYAEIESVKVECFNGNGIGSNKGKTYYYNNERGTNDTVVDGDKKHILASLQATGLDMDKGKKTDDDNKDNDNKDSDKSTVPGGSNGSPGDDHSDDTGKDTSKNGGGNSSNNSNCKEGDFCQGNDSSSDNSSKDGNAKGGSSKSSASALAIIIAGFALYWLQ